MLNPRNEVKRLFPFLLSNTAQRYIDDEILFHIEMRTQENINSGMAYDEARRNAVMRFGKLAHIKRECLKVYWDNHVGLKMLKYFLWIAVAFGLTLRLTGSTRGVKPMGDLIAMSAIFLRLLIHLRLTGPARSAH